MNKRIESYELCKTIKWGNAVHLSTAQPGQISRRLVTVGRPEGSAVPGVNFQDAPFEAKGPPSMMGFIRVCANEWPEHL